MNLNKYFDIAKVNILNSLAYVGDFLARGIFLVLIVIIFLNLWTAIYGSTGSTVLQGYSINNMIWYLIIAESVMLSHGRIEYEIQEDVISGEIAYSLTKPYQYVIYRFFLSFGKGLLNFATIFLIASGVALLTVGAPTISLLSIPFVIISVLLALSLQRGIGIFIGLLSFWFEDIRAFSWIYGKLTLTIGGVIIPLEFFPSFVRKIANILPFSSLAYVPGKIFAGFDFYNALSLIRNQIIWFLIFVLILFIVNNFAKKRIAINGG